MPISDLELVAKAVEGNETAFREIVSRYAKDLYRLAYSLTGNATDAEDILQETFAGAFKGLARFEGRSSLKTWLVRILVRQVARHRRYWRLRRTASIERLQEDSGGAYQGPSIDSHGPAVESKMDLHVMLATLVAEHREAIVLRELQGMSYKEIGEALDIPIGTVESRLFRARRELRRNFADYFRGDSDGTGTGVMEGTQGVDPS